MSVGPVRSADRDRFSDPRRDGRRTLDAAKGVLVALRHCSLDEAFIEIVQTAKQYNADPMKLARALVATAENDPITEPNGAIGAAIDRAWGTLLGKARQDVARR